MVCFVLQWCEYLSFEDAMEPRLHVDRDHVSSLWMPPSIKGRVVMPVVTLHRWTFLLKVMPLPNIILAVIGGSGESFVDVHIQAIFLAWTI